MRAGATRWREVFVLAAGHEQRYGKTSNAVAAVSELCPMPCPTEAAASKTVAAARWAHAQIAGEALLEIGAENALRSENGRALWMRIQEWLAALVEQPRQPSARVRAAAGVTLAKLGDPRAYVTDPLQMEFCCVPAGPFLMGEGEEQYTHDLDYAYWIARFPVTNAHYQHFIDAEGYANPDFWPEAIAHKRWRDGQVYRYYGYYDDKNEFQVWTRSLWGEDWQKASFHYPYFWDDGREELTAGDWAARLLRGGSSYSEMGGVGCGVRGRHNPNDVFRNHGFRVMLSPFTSGL